MKRTLSNFLPKLLLIATILSITVAFFAFDFDEKLRLGYLKDQAAAFQAFYAEAPYLTMGVFGAVYIVVTGLSLPGAAILTVVAGAFFGLGVGTIIVSFASTIGATLAFLFSRYLFHWCYRYKRSSLWRLTLILFIKFMSLSCLVFLVLRNANACSVFVTLV